MADFPTAKSIIAGVDPESAAFANNYLVLFEQLLREKGADTKTWIARAGITVDDLKNTGGFISFAQMEKLLEDEAIVALFDEIGLEIGERLTITSHGIVGQLAMTGNTYMDSFHLFLSFIKLRTRLTHFDIKLRGLELISSFSNQIEHAPLRRLVADSSLSGAYHFTNHLLDNKRAVSRIEFDCEPTQWHLAFAEKVYCPVTFSHEKPLIAINLLALLRPAPTANPLLQKVAMQQCASLLEELEAANSLTQKIRTLLNYIPEYALSQQRVADCLNITPRTLRRKLAVEGTNFKDLTDQVMKDYVSALMQQKSLSIGEIADMLGYSNESNFNKACKRWFGMSAAQLRGSD